MAEVSFDKDLLDHLLNILGFSTNELCFFLPYYEANPGAAEDIQDISSRGLHATNITAYDNVPVIRGLMRSTRFNGTDEVQEIADNILLTPISGGIDAPFSVGIAFKMDAVNAAKKHLINKFDDQTPNAEWEFFLDAAEKLNLRLYDDSVGVAVYRGRLYNTALVVQNWYIGMATYNGIGTDAPEGGISLYLWNAATRLWMGAVDDAASTAGVGPYVDMEDTAQPVMIGAADTAGGPIAAEFFDGEIAMPWYTRKELSAAEAELAALDMVRLLGL